jgi:hypothetical protein
MSDNVVSIDAFRSQVFIDSGRVTYSTTQEEIGLLLFFVMVAERGGEICVWQGDSQVMARQVANEWVKGGGRVVERFDHGS